MKTTLLIGVFLAAGAGSGVAEIRAGEVDCSNAYEALEGAVAKRQGGDLTGAERQMRSIRDDCPSFVNARLELAVTLSWTGDLNSAIDEYTAVLQLEPANRAALLGKARVLSWRGDTHEAREIYGGLLLAEPENSRALNGLALTHRVDGRFGAARRLYREVIALDPGNDEAAEGLRALSRATNVEGTMVLGQVAVQDGRQSVGNFAGLTWRPTGRSSYSGSLRTSATAGDTRSRTTTTLGTDQKVSRKLNIRFAYEHAVSSEGHRGALALSASWRTSNTTSLLGSIKPATDTRGGRDVLVSLGAVQSIKSSGYVIVQVFHFRSSTGYRSLAVAASAQLRLSDRIQAQPMLSVSHDSFRTVLDVGVGATARLTDHFGAGLHAGAGSAGSGLSRFGVSFAYRR